MYRINRVFENEALALVRIEGEVNDRELVDWEQALQSIWQGNRRRIILDFCEVAFLSPRAVEALVRQLEAETLLLNCSTTVRNMICSAGCSQNLLGGESGCQVPTSAATYNTIQP